MGTYIFGYSNIDRGTLSELRSIIVLFALEFCLSVTSKGCICISMGLSSKGPNIGSYVSS